MTKAILGVLGAVLLVGCNPPPTSGTGGGSGATGGGTAATGGGTAATGGGSATGGGGGATTLSLGGTATAPSGVSIASSYVIACAWINDTCDDVKSGIVQLTASGSSAPYLIEDLENGHVYFVVVWKDVNGNQDIDTGDYFGVVVDQGGNARVFTESATGANATMALREPTTQPSAIPAELLGEWSTGSSTYVSTWEFRASGAVNHTYFAKNGICANQSSSTSVDGTVTINGTAMTFNPSSAQRTETPCTGAATVTSTYVNPRHLTWRVAARSSGGGQSLYLTDAQGTESEFPKL